MCETFASILIDNRKEKKCKYANFWKLYCRKNMFTVHILIPCNWTIFQTTCTRFGKREREKAKKAQKILSFYFAIELNRAQKVKSNLHSFPSVVPYSISPNRWEKQNHFTILKYLQEMKNKCSMFVFFLRKY